MFLILIDTHSKWIEAAVTSSTLPACVTKELQSSFARFGSPEMSITDIATCFTSAEFKTFLERNVSNMLHLHHTIHRLMVLQREIFRF